MALSSATRIQGPPTLGIFHAYRIGLPPRQVFVKSSHSLIITASKMRPVGFCLKFLGALYNVADASPRPSLGRRAAGDDAYASALNSLLSATATRSSPTDIAQASSALSAIAQASPTNLYDYAGKLAANGLTSDAPGSDLTRFISGVLTGQNSDTNINLRSPAQPVYPKAAAGDAPYDLSEAQLRAAIYIPSTFKYGNGAQPVQLPRVQASTMFRTCADSCDCWSVDNPRTRNRRYVGRCPWTTDSVSMLTFVLH